MDRKRRVKHVGIETVFSAYLAIHDCLLRMVYFHGIHVYVGAAKRAT